MNIKLILFPLILLAGPLHAQEQQPLPIIDMHLHAVSADENGPPPLGLCLPMVAYMPAFDPQVPWSDVFLASFKKPRCSAAIWSPTTDEALLNEMVEVLERHNIIGVLSGPPDRVLLWRKAAPDRFIASVELRIGRDAYTPDSLRQLFEGGSFVVLGEVSNQYAGIAPNDKRMEPYWALAEALDIAVAYHMGEGPPGTAALIPTYRAQLSSPFLLEEVLNRHPRLRISVMHYGSPHVDEMIAMLGAYPQLYIDLGGIQWFYPREYFYAQLQQFIDAGFGKRVMFGSDALNWPGVIEPAIAIIEEAPFLSEEQKRNILYNNAARFLRLSKQETVHHHGRKINE